MLKTKKCRKCTVEKPISEFYKDSTKTDGYNNRCKECLKLDHAKYYEKNSDKIRAYRRNYGRVFRYGIDENHVLDMIKEQEFKCPVCGNEINLTSHVDHDHESGIIRGILCKNCNIALGLLSDDIGNLFRAADYLIYHKLERFVEEIDE